MPDAFWQLVLVVRVFVPLTEFSIHQTYSNNQINTLAVLRAALHEFC